MWVQSGQSGHYCGEVQQTRGRDSLFVLRNCSAPLVFYKVHPPIHLSYLELLKKAWLCNFTMVILSQFYLWVSNVKCWTDKIMKNILHSFYTIQLLSQVTVKYPVEKCLANIYFVLFKSLCDGVKRIMDAFMIVIFVWMLFVHFLDPYILGHETKLHMGTWWTSEK